jgi:curli production assembly/transport component CsgG
MVVKSIIQSIILATLLAGCSLNPKWSEGPGNCEYGEGKYAQGWNTDFDADGILNDDLSTIVRQGYTGTRKYIETRQICVEGPEVVRLPSYVELLNLPPAKSKPVVAVYGFLDKTGQRKDSQTGQSFSTAVTQGGVELLIDALKTAGDGTWFRVVERNGIDALVRERQIIRSGRDEAAKALGTEPQKLSPLLFAGMIIEGGIIGYDTNVRTGGRGARTLGIGFTKQYRQDVVTVSVRAVSVLTGEILLNVQTKKTILSYGGGGDVFRFIEQGTQLVEFEDGVGNNESVTYAVRTAIEAAVLELVYQGDERGYWTIEKEEENE